MARKIKVHYYSISSNCGTELQELLSDLSSMSLEERTRSVNRGDVCLEIADEIDGRWFLHFTSARLSNWPGVGYRGHLSNDLALDDDAQLTENTFAAYDPVSGTLAIQYTHSSVRPTRMFRYFDSYTGSVRSYTYTPILNEDALERYAQKHVYTRIDAVINNVTDADVEHFSGGPIASTVRESVQSGIANVQISFRADARVTSNRINRRFIRRFVDRLLERQSERDKVIVFGRDSEDTATEPIDLLKDAKTALYPESRVTLTPGRRYRPEDMQIILFDALSN